MGQYSCHVLDQTEITADIYRMSLKVDEIARDGHPGQFVHLRIGNGTDPLLRRPLSIHRVDREQGRIELLYRVVGRGTGLMRKAEQGDIYDLLGPLGRGFRMDGSFSHALVVAGGMGSAPVFFLIDELLLLGKQVTLFWGVKCKSEIFDLPDLKNNGVEVRVATEDGSMGHDGLITDILKQFIEDRREDSSLEGYVCGPKGMLKKIQAMARETSCNWQVSVEERMACGTGVCLGCAIQVKQGGYKMVCSDGPVFDLGEIVFDG